MQTSAQVEAKLAEIKVHMPKLYDHIQCQAKVRGREVFALVRRGLKGESNCFWACEAGRVVGTPFATDVSAEVARLIVQFGFGFLCMFQEGQKVVGDGTH